MSPCCHSPKGRIILITIAAVLACALDQVSKWWIFSTYPEYVPHEIIADFLYVTPVYNPGVAFGQIPWAKDILLYAVPVLLVVILVYTWQLRKEPLIVLLLMGFIFGGALGNYIDRLNIGKVYDFIDVKFGDLYDYPVFNIADAFISCSVVLLILINLWSIRAQNKHESA